MRYEKIDTRQEDLFRNRLSNQLRPDHELVKLSDKIAWQELEEEFANMHPPRGGGGRSAKPIRVVVGVLLLQYMHGLSDENVLRMWVENPYWQYFCGYDFMEWEAPIDSSSLTRWRNRMGPERLEKILSMTVKASVDCGAVKAKDLKTIVADTTVMCKNITFPTDIKLFARAREHIVKFAAKNKIKLRQNYNRVIKKLLFRANRYFHAKQMKRAKKVQRTIKTIVGRVLRDCQRKIMHNENLKKEFVSLSNKTERLLKQKRNDKGKLYSMHEDTVDCMTKGKAHKRYEFGCKVALGMTHSGTGIVTAAEALHGNPYDGHTLVKTLESSKRITGTKVQTAFVDKGYKGHGIEDVDVFISGQRRGITKSIKRKLKRRQAIEPLIGHMKNETKLGVCRLKGIKGDQVNALLCAAAYNLKLILNYMRDLLDQIFYAIFTRRTFRFLAIS